MEEVKAFKDIDGNLHHTRHDAIISQMNIRNESIEEYKNEVINKLSGCSTFEQIFDLIERPECFKNRGKNNKITLHPVVTFSDMLKVDREVEEHFNHKGN